VQKQQSNGIFNNAVSAIWSFGPADLFWLAAIMITGAILWLPGLGTRDLWTSGEARAAQVARRMVANNDYVTMRLQMNMPHLTVRGTDGPDALSYDPEGQTVVYEHQWRQQVFQNISTGPLQPEIPYRQLTTIHKPVFYYWLIAGAHKLGMDINKTTVRCFSTVPAILLLAVTYLLGCVLYERRVGLLAAAALGTCVQFWWQARICQMDMLLALIMTAVFLLWYIGDRARRPGIRLAAFTGVYLLLAAASLMKSFAYMLLAGLIVLIYLAVETIVLHEKKQWPRAYLSRIWLTMKRMHFFAGAVLYLALVAPWFVLIHQATDGQYTREMFLTHMFSRAGLMQYGYEFETKTQWWFYLARICVDMFPWVIMIPGAVVQVFRARCRDTWRAGTYLLGWFAAWLVFFSCMHFRKNEYILPMYPAAMILAAKMLSDFIRDQASDIHLGRAIRLAFIGLTVGVIAAAGFAAGLINEQFLERVTSALGTNENDKVALQSFTDLLANNMTVAIVGMASIVAAMAAALVLSLYRKTGTALVLLAGCTAAFMLFGTNVLMDRVINPRRTQQAFAGKLQAHTSQINYHKSLILFGTEQHELVYLMPNRFDSVPWVKPCKHIIREVDPIFALKSRLAAENKPILIVMEREHWQRIIGTVKYRAKTFGKREPYVERITEVPLPELQQYNENHRESLILLRYDPTPATKKTDIIAPANKITGCAADIT